MPGSVNFAKAIQANSFFMEYAFARAVKAANDELPAGSQLKKSQAMAMRERLEQSIRSDPDAGKAFVAGTSVLGQGVSLATFQRNLVGVLKEATGRPDLGVVEELERVDPSMGMKEVSPGLYTYLKDFAGMTGVELKIGPAKGRRQPASPMLPLSPYMPGLADRSVMMDNGMQTLYMTDPDVVADYNDLGTLDESVTLSAAVDRSLDVPDRLKEAGPALLPDDRSGLSALRPFMSDKEYRDLSADDWVARGGWERDPATGKVSEVKFMDPASIARVREVVRQLRESGTSFTFQRDKRRGQAKIHFDTGMDVRVIDPYMPAYAGARCYDDGVSMYYQMEGMRVPGSKQRFMEYVPKTPEECLDLIRFSLGEPVSRWDQPEKRMGVPETAPNGRNTSFHASKNFRVRAGTRKVDGQTVQVSIFHKVKRSPSAKFFEKEEDAEAFLRESIGSARENLSGQIDLEGILELAAERRAALDKAEELGDEELRAQAEGMIPAFSYNPDVKALQEKYWEVMTTEGTTLFRPDSALDDVGESSEDVVTEEELSAAMYEGSPEAVCRRHLADTLDCFVGSYEPDASGLRFDPVNVSKFMTSSGGIFRNNDDLTAAMRKADVKPDELRGSDYYTNVFKGKLIRFDPKSAQPMKGYVAHGADGSVVRGGFMDRMFDVVKQSIESNGCLVDDDDILVDRNGIVHYKARRVEAEMAKKTGTRDSRRPVEVEGEIGQLFPPDEHGVVNAGDHLFVPGYLARIEPNKPGEDRPYEQRIVLEGYEQVLAKTIRDTLRRDLLVTDSRELGVPYSLNTAVRKLYDTRYPLDFYQRTAEGGMSDELRQAIIDTNKSRVRLDKRFMTESGRMALYQARQKPGFDPLDDYRMDAMTLTDGRNPAILEAAGDGLFDPSFTGNGGAQGVRYLVEGTEVTPDGHIVPGDPGARCAMVNYLRESGRFPDFDAVDRMNMTGNGLLHGLRETEPVGMAQVSLGGMTFEDGIVVSKAFAETHMVARQSDGAMRPLTIGDKMECHGNKGVIGAIIDPDMSDELARERGLWDARELFRKNPELQVCMSPYSSVSRFNAGMGMEAIASGPSDLTMPDGTVHKGSVGYVKMTILEQTADKKTHFSEDGTQKRAYGAQLVWSLASNDCPEVIRDSFQDNYKSLANLRELLLTCGMDVDPTGRFVRGYRKQPGEERRTFEMGPLVWKEFERQGVAGRRLDKTGMRQAFGEQISMMGGFMEVPFPVRMYTGDMSPEIPPEERSEASREAYPGPTYRVPVMSAYLRSGQELDDGESVVHDYTNSYLGIYAAAVEFQAAYADAARLEAMAEEGPLSTEDKEDLAKARKAMAKAPTDAQAEYSKIADDVVQRKFQGKRNFFRTGMMSNKQSRSATAIWSPDISMMPDTIGMNPEMAMVMGVARKGDDGKIELIDPENTYALLHRDPVIMPSGVRYMKTVLREDATGITINPMCVGGYQGDFDGDTVGIHEPHGSRARKEAMDRLSVRANLLDQSSFDEDTGRYRLFIAGGQDIAAAWAADPSLKESYDELERRVNDFEKAFKSGEINKTRLNELRDEAILDIGGYLYDCSQASFGRHVISYESQEAHIQSIEKFVDDKAKGSLGKVRTYAQFMGVDYDTTEDGHLEPGTLREYDKDGSLRREANIGILKAKNMQQQYTGSAGQFSIRAVKPLFNVDPAAATTLNALATQAVLQVKHDPEMADRMEQLLNGPARELWRGHKMEPCTVRVVGPDGNDEYVDSWKTLRDAEGQPVRATREEFRQQFLDVYRSKRGMGLDVNPELVGRIADACSGPDGLMRNIEKEQCELTAAPMQQLAYGGTFDTILELAEKQAKDPSYPGLFEAMPGSPHDYNACLADGTVMRFNLQLKQDQAAGRRLEEDFKAICRKDTQVAGAKKEPTHLTAMGQSVRTGGPGSGHGGRSPVNYTFAGAGTDPSVQVE